jgi:uncharacterized protein YkwD
VSPIPKTISRRSFLNAGAAFALLQTIARGQIPIERGRFSDDDLPLARNQLLELVNAERSRAGLSLLEFDELACKVAGAHALDLLTGQFLSHWGSDGRKPYQRYSFAGGIDAIQENVGRADYISSVTPNGVSGELAEMHTEMYLETPPNDGHRRAILSPQHTHAGFGVALKDHNLRLVELYVARYLHVDPVERQAKRRAAMVLTGRLLNAKHFLQEVDIFYEPLPVPPDADWLHTPRPYSLPDVYLGLRPKAPKGTIYTDGTTGDFDWDSNGQFRVPAKLFTDTSGIYTIVFWVRRVPAEKAFPAAQICIRVE